MGSAVSLFEIPLEVTEHVLKFCHPCDFATVSMTCRMLHTIIYGQDQYLWREAFLAYPFDDLRKSLHHRPETIYNWRTELQKRIKADRILRTTSFTDVDAENIEETENIIGALEVLLEAIDSVTPGEFSELGNKSDTLEWVRDVLTSSSVFREALTLPMNEEPDLDTVEYKFRQLRARLRSCLTLAHEKGDTTESEIRLYETRNTSRCFVYDLRNYADETFWGPYEARPLERGCFKVSVDWEHVEHIQNVVFANLRELPSMWLRPTVPGFDIQAVRPYSAPKLAGRKPRDWAGVEGIWRRIVCFMDYRDLFSFNFTTRLTMRLKPHYFEEDFAEAVRVIEIGLEIDEDVEVPPEDDDDPDPACPPIAFSGTARGVHMRRMSLVTGVVRKKRDYIRWTFVDVVTTHTGDSSRWSAEGVQVGSVGSALGIAGIWTVAVHEDNGDPAGPFWMWKASESIPDKILPLPE